MYVKATDKFDKYGIFPKELGFIPSEGHVFEVTEERFKLLTGNNVYRVAFVEATEKPVKRKKVGKKDNKIAIIIPNCNYSEYIDRCITSILNQTYKNYEIIFVDDISTDDSVQVAKSLLKKPHKVIALKQKRYNGGARNEAYLHLSKDVDYIWYVDSDDWLPSPDVLEEINENLVTAPDVLFLGMDYCKKGSISHYCRPNYSDKYEAIKGWSGSCGKVVRTELATRQDCLYNEGTLKEDKNHHCKICIHMDDFKCLPKACYVWNRDNKKSVSTKREKVYWGTSTIRHWADTVELYLAEKGHDPIIDKYLEERIELAKNEVYNGGDRQL